MRDAVIVYFDAPVVVSIIMVDAHSPMPGRWYEGLSASVIISDLANLEVSAVISREFRAKRYTRAQADKAVGEFETLRVTGPATARNRVSASCRTLDSRRPAGTAMP
jgi:hypothetical protein